MSEVIKHNEDGVFAFIKFGDQDNIIKLQNGQLHMKNFKYFRELENRTSIKGIGDKDEAYFKFNDVNLKFLDYETGVEVFSGKASSTMFSMNDIELTPVFCLYCLDFRALKIVDSTEDSFQADLYFSDDH